MTSGIEALFTKARESLAAAQVLIKDGYYDFAASRAYYAMFYVASALLAVLGLSYSSHAAVISAFGREFAKSGKLDPKFHHNSGRLATGDVFGSGMHGLRHQPHAQRRADTANGIEARLCISPQRLVKRFAR